MYTQPRLYDKINQHPDTLAVYGKQLVAEGTSSPEALEDIRGMVNRTLEAEFLAAKTWETPKHDWLSSKVPNLTNLSTFVH